MNPELDRRRRQVPAPVALPIVFERFEDSVTDRLVERSPRTRCVLGALSTSWSSLVDKPIAELGKQPGYSALELGVVEKSRRP